MFGQAPTRASTPPGSSPRPNLTTLQWANIAFTVVTGSLVIAGGRLGDLLGRRRMLVTGTVVFTLASAVAAGAPKPRGPHHRAGGHGRRRGADPPHDPGAHPTKVCPLGAAAGARRVGSGGLGVGRPPGQRSAAC